MEMDITVYVATLMLTSDALVADKHKKEKSRREVMRICTNMFYN
jgi:hypothetical protein